MQVPCNSTLHHSSKNSYCYHETITIFDHKIIINELEISKTRDTTEGLGPKKLSIGPLERVSYPVGQWNNTKIILETTRCKLILYHPRTAELTDPRFQKLGPCLGIFAYEQSLVSIA